jgi:hypothetical protein
VTRTPLPLDREALAGRPPSKEVKPPPAVAKEINPAHSGDVADNKPRAGMI